MLLVIFQESRREEVAVTKCWHSCWFASEPGLSVQVPSGPGG